MSFKNMGFMQQENIKRVVLKENPLNMFIKNDFKFIFYSKVERCNFKEKLFYYVVGFKDDILITNITTAKRTGVLNNVKDWKKNLLLNGFIEIKGGLV